MVRHLVEMIGNVKLVELKVRDVDFALGKLAERFSTRSVRLARMILIQACRIPAYPSSRSRTRRATPAPGQPKSCTGTSSGRVTRTAAMALGPLFESKGKTNEDQS